MRPQTKPHKTKQKQHANSYVPPSLGKIPTTKDKRYGGVLSFDESDRRSFVSGFRTRKIQRRQAAQADQQKMARESKLVERADRREAKKAEAEIAAESKSFGVLPNPKKKLKAGDSEGIRINQRQSRESGDEESEDDTGDADETVVQFEDEEDEGLVTVTTTVLGNKHFHNPAGSDESSDESESEVEVSRKNQSAISSFLQKKNAPAAVDDGGFSGSKSVRQQSFDHDSDDHSDDGNNSDTLDVESNIVEFWKPEAPVKKNHHKRGYDKVYEEFGIGVFPSGKERFKDKKRNRERFTDDSERRDGTSKNIKDVKTFKKRSKVVGRGGRTFDR